MKQMSQRQERVAELLRQEIAGLLTRNDFAHPLVNSMVTISHIWISPDMKHARVYFTVMDPNMVIKDVAEALNLERHRFQKMLAGLDMKYIPRLKFYFDEEREKSEHLAEVLRKAHQETLQEDEAEA